MKKQTLSIIAILAIGTLFSVAYSASTIISDTGITTPSLTATTITVTGTCTGCGSEGTFTNWTTLTNSSTVTTDPLSGGTFCQIDTHGNTLYLDGDNIAILTSSTGTKILEKSTAASSLNKIFDQSASSGKYQVIEASSSTINVYSNAVLVKTVGIKSTNFINADPVICVSADGKYIGVLGQASANHERVVILQGS